MRKQTQSILTLMPHTGLLTDFSILNSILWSQNLTGLIVYLRVRLTHSLFLLGWWQFGIKDLNRFIVVVLYFVIISTMFMQGHFYSFLVMRTLWFGKKFAIVRKKYFCALVSGTVQDLSNQIMSLNETSMTLCLQAPKNLQLPSLGFFHSC